MKEAQLHRAVAAYLDYALPAGSWWRSIANESPAGVGWRRKLHGHGVRAGTPDILICSGGIPIFIELKSEKGQQTKAQRDTFANLMAQGFDCTIARSVAEVQAYLEFCGVPLRAKVAA